MRLALMVNEENAQAVVDGLKTDNAVRGDVIALARRREGPLPEDAPGARRLLFELGAACGEKLCALWRAQRRAGADEAAAQVSAPSVRKLARLRRAPFRRRRKAAPRIAEYRMLPDTH